MKETTFKERIHYLIYEQHHKVQKTSCTHFIISSKRTFLKQSYYFYNSFSQSYGRQIQVYNVLAKLLLNTTYSTFFFKKYVLQKCKKKGILYFLFMSMLYHNQQCQNKLLQQFCTAKVWESHNGTSWLGLACTVL